MWASKWSLLSSVTPNNMISSEIGISLSAHLIVAKWLVFPETGTAGWLSPYFTLHDDVGIGIRNVNFHVVRIIHKLLLLHSKVEIIHLIIASLSGGGCPGCPEASTFGTASPYTELRPHGWQTRVLQAPVTLIYQWKNIVGKDCATWFRSLITSCSSLRTITSSCMRFLECIKGCNELQKSLEFPAGKLQLLEVFSDGRIATTRFLRLLCASHSMAALVL